MAGHAAVPARSGWLSALAMLRDQRGVAALEFALMAPLLLSMYFVTMEVAQAIETNKKVGRVSSMVADLVTQQQTITKSELEAIMSIGESTLQPYDRSKPTIIITGDRDHRRDDPEGQGGLVAQAGQRQPSASLPPRAPRRPSRRPSTSRAAFWCASRPISPTSR